MTKLIRTVFFALAFSLPSALVLADGTPTLVPDDYDTKYTFNTFEEFYSFVSGSEASCKSGKYASCVEWAAGTSASKAANTVCTKTNAKSECEEVGVNGSTTKRPLIHCMTRRVIKDGLAYNCKICCFLIPTQDGRVIVACPTEGTCVQEQI